MARASDITLFEGTRLSAGRLHEAFGPSARAFAAMAVAAAGEARPVLWARGRDPRRHLNPLGLAPFFNPGRLILAECERPLDILWCMEEALRFSPAALVIAELTKPMDLTISRRLQLASEAGGGIGLALVDDAPVSNAAETRWFCAPVLRDCGENVENTDERLGERIGENDGEENGEGFGETPVDNRLPAQDSTRWRLSLIKNKKGTNGHWEIEWNAPARCISVVSKIAGGSAIAFGSYQSGAAFCRGARREERAAALRAEQGG